MLVATFPCCCTNFLFQLWKRIQTCSEKHPVDVSAFEKLTDEEKMNKRSSKMIFPSRHGFVRTKEGTIMEIEWSELCPVSSVTVMIYESYPRDALKLEWQLIGRIARNLLSIVTNVFSRRMECGWLLNRLNADSPISFSLHARESSVQASDKWYLIKLYCANNDHNAFGSTRPDFYSSILDNWYFRGHEHRYLCAIEPCKIPLSSCLRIIDRKT